MTTLKELHRRFLEVQKAGDRDAVTKAGAAIRDRLDGDDADDEIEFRFSIVDPWERRLFFARCRRYGFEPYRHERQPGETVMLRAPRRFVDEVLWPEHIDATEIFIDFLDEVTSSITEEVLGQEDRDLIVVPETETAAYSPTPGEN